MNPTVLALLRERAGYIARGLSDRVAEVDKELARLGHTRPGAAPESTALASPPENTANPRPRKRGSDAQE